MNLDEKKLTELFSTILSNLLYGTIDRGRENYLIIIDAIDEAASDTGINELTELIANEFGKLPKWINFLITSRPEYDITARLQMFNPVVLDAQSEDNTKDIREYLNVRFGKYDKDIKNKAIDVIIERCEGMFLYASEICNEIEDPYNKSVVIYNPEQFPKGLNNLYLNYFERKFTKTGYGNELAPAILEIVLSALSPISIEHISILLQEGKRTINNEFIKLSSFVSEVDKKVFPFHKSLSEWLFNKKHSIGFYIDTKDAHKLMGKEHARLLDILNSACIII